VGEILAEELTDIGAKGARVAFLLHLCIKIASAPLRRVSLNKIAFHRKMKFLYAPVEFFRPLNAKTAAKGGRSLPKITLLLTDPFAAIDKPR